MRFAPTSILLLTVGGTFVSAFQHSPTDADGLYVHGYDASGSEIKNLIDPTNPIIPPEFRNKTAFANKPAPTRNPASAILKRDNFGAHCNGIQSSPNDIYWATHDLGQACDNLGWWHSAISYQFQGAIAYACDYGNGNHCDSTSMMARSTLIDIACGSDREGWYTVSNWKYAEGRTNAGTGFCR